jgi:hypothetical protein
MAKPKESLPLLLTGKSTTGSAAADRAPQNYSSITSVETNPSVSEKNVVRFAL